MPDLTADRPGRDGGFPAVAQACALTCALALVAPAAIAQDAAEPAGAAASRDFAPKHLTLLAISSATVAPNGLAFTSLSLSSKRRGVAGGDWDGSLAAGLGLGSAETAVGVQLTAFLTSLSDQFGDSGYFQVKLSRRVRPGPAPVYLGAEIDSLAAWGDAGDNPVSGKVMATWFPSLRTAGGSSFPLMFTIGYGTDLRLNFVNREIPGAGDSGATSTLLVAESADPAVFFGAGIGLTRNIAASAAWTGDSIDLGASFLFDGLDWFNISAELNDVTDRTNSRRFSINFNFFRPGLFRS